MRKILAGVAALGVVLIAGGAIALRTSEGLQDRLFERALEGRISQSVRTIDESSAYVFICGSGSPMPDLSRASACTAIISGGDIYLVDTGPGSAEVLQTSGLDLSRLKGIFFTHYHSDHIGDLGEIAMQSWAAGRVGPLPVYGPQGVEDVATGFALAYRLDEGYRVAHHDAAHMPPGSMQMAAQEIDQVPFDVGAMKVTPIEVNHDPIRPAYGFRFDLSGRTIVVSGDTVPNQNLIRIGEGADVLLHEALSKELVAKIAAQIEARGNGRLSDMLNDTLDYHTSPKQAAEIANEMEAKLLVISHVVPPLPNGLVERIYMRGVSNVRSDGVVLARDGMLIELPGGSDEIIVN